MKESLRESIDVEKLLRPETELERSLLAADEFRHGLFWGKPRYGHPEGLVLYHIREVLDNIDKLVIDPTTRSKLRIITFAHDTFKYKEDKSDWSTHHSILARQFMEDFIEDQMLLDIIELHDEAYYSWRLKVLYNRVEEGQKRLDKLIDRIGNQMQLYYLFFKCDTKTGDKTQSPLYWFEKNIEGIDIIQF
jgi:hypothetical protein